MSGFSERKPLSIDYPVSTGSAAPAARTVPLNIDYPVSTGSAAPAAIAVPQSEYRKRMAEFEKEFKKNLEEAERKIKALQNSYEY